MNKKGDWDAPRSVPALILGLIILAMGLFPLLGQFGILNLNLPYTPVGIVLEIILTIGGLYLFIMGCMEDDFIRVITIIISLIVLTVGVIPLLSNFGIGIALPFLQFLYSPYLYAIVGLTLVISAWAVQY